jgi:hypothetical protein
VFYAGQPLAINERAAMPTKITLKGGVIPTDKEVLTVTESADEVLEKVNDALITPQQPHIMLTDADGNKKTTINATLFLDAVEA